MTAGNLEFETVVENESGGGPAAPRVDWMAPEGPHAVENVDSRPYRAVRVELKPR